MTLSKLDRVIISARGTTAIYLQTLENTLRQGPEDDRLTDDVIPLVVAGVLLVMVEEYIGSRAVHPGTLTEFVAQMDDRRDDLSDSDADLDAIETDLIAYHDTAIDGLLASSVQ